MCLLNVLCSLVTVCHKNNLTFENALAKLQTFSQRRAIKYVNAVVYSGFRLT